jgi:BON domain
LRNGNTPDARFQFQGGTVVKVRYLSTLAATAGVLVAGQAAEPARLPASTAPVTANQQLADAVAGRLATAAAGADLTVIAQDGVVTLSGTVRDEAQRGRVIREVQGTKGVTLVRDAIAVPAAVTPAQGTAPATLPPTATPVPSFGPVMAAPTVATPPGGVYGAPVVEPVPLGPAGGGAADLGAPPLPPYAWPTYAPYNNVSRVGYPQAYPYNAFPFIGPYYPFPKVPLGWRSVLLEWQDGFWWIGKTQAPHDYWRVRFW